MLPEHAALVNAASVAAAAPSATITFDALTIICLILIALGVYIFVRASKGLGALLLIVGLLLFGTTGLGHSIYGAILGAISGAQRGAKS
jgi:formate/nitrite transporter FocA (FNT family)